MDDAAVRDELAIRNLVARYADAVNRRDEAAWADTWAEAGEWSLLGRAAQGREAARELLAEFLAGLSLVVQVPASGVVRVQGDRATGRWTITEQGKLANGNAFLSLAAYDDEYERGAGEWRFASRRLTLFYMGPPDLSA